MTGMAMVGVWAAWMLQGQAEAAPVQSWAAVVDAAKADPAHAAACESLLSQARERAAKPIVKRAHKLDEVGQNRTWLDGRSNFLEPEIKETFALAMSDFAACNELAQELPLLAAAYRITGEQLFLERVRAQLEETAAWRPLQRPGWTLYTPGNRLPADGKDGNWLATGCGVRAIADSLELLPAGALDDALLTRLHELLEGEAAGVVDDWQTQRSWFIRTNNPVTNQWVLPTEGLVRACLVLGRDGHHDAYALGVANLLKALDAHGPNGEFEEGFGYAQFTVSSMLHTARAMALAGDRRGLDHPFLRRFPVWLVEHFQPADMIVNCFDAGTAHGGAERSRPFLSLAAFCTGSPAARWALTHQAGGPSDDLAGLAARALPPVGDEAAPPLFAAYERAARVNWRSSWDADASGVWVRGGHPLDQHDHQDRGHVNLIAHGRPILIEAGTPSYSHPMMMSLFASGIGHNVLQLGTAFPEGATDPGKYFHMPGWQKQSGIAPITVQRLDKEGGDVTVDATACYDGLSKWLRHVTWTADELTVNDEVQLADDATDIILFRWHLNAGEDTFLEGTGESYTVSWAAASMELEGSTTLTAAMRTLPDATLAGHDGSENPANVHTCLEVWTRKPEAALRLTTRVRPK